jgi:hypothetical protein
LTAAVPSLPSILFRECMPSGWSKFSVSSRRSIAQRSHADETDSYSVDAKFIQGDKGVVSALVHQGLMPCTPFAPTVAVSTRVLELYRISHLCCPHLAIQPFVKGLCDLHGVGCITSSTYLKLTSLAGCLPPLPEPAVLHLL